LGYAILISRNGLLNSLMNGGSSWPVLPLTESQLPPSRCSPIDKFGMREVHLFLATSKLHCRWSFDTTKYMKLWVLWCEVFEWFHAGRVVRMQFFQFNFLVKLLFSK
jgi:hypothetical protein